MNFLPLTLAPQTSSVGLSIHELLRKALCQTPPQTYLSRICIFSRSQVIYMHIKVLEAPLSTTTWGHVPGEREETWGRKEMKTEFLSLKPGKQMPIPPVAGLYQSLSRWKSSKGVDFSLLNLHPASGLWICWIGLVQTSMLSCGNISLN